VLAGVWNVKEEAGEGDWNICSTASFCAMLGNSFMHCVYSIVYIMSLMDKLCILLIRLLSLWLLSSNLGSWMQTVLVVYSCCADESMSRW